MDLRTFFSAVDETSIIYDIGFMDFMKPFLAGSFGVAALLRSVVTILVDFGATPVLDLIGIARLSMSGVFILSMVGGAIFAWRASKRPFTRAKKT